MISFSCAAMGPLVDLNVLPVNQSIQLPKHLNLGPSQWCAVGKLPRGASETRQITRGTAQSPVLGRQLHLTMSISSSANSGHSLCSSLYFVGSTLRNMGACSISSPSVFLHPLRPVWKLLCLWTSVK